MGTLRFVRGCVSIGAIVSSGVLLAMAGCSTSSSSAPVSPDGGTATGTGTGTDPGTNPLSGTDTPWVFYTSIDLTGDNSPASITSAKSLILAQDEVNAAGGVFGHPIKVRIEDGATQLATHQAKVTEALGLNPPIVAFIGPLRSGDAVGTQKALYDAKVVQMGFGGGAPELSTLQPPLDRYYFRTTASHALQARAMALFASSAVADPIYPYAACKSVSIVNSDDSYGNGTATALISELGKRTPAITFKKQIKVPSATKTSYADEIGQIMASEPDCMALIFLGTPGTKYMADWAKAVAGTPGVSEPKPQFDATKGKFRIIASNAFKVDSFLKSGVVNNGDPIASLGVYGTLVDPAPSTPQFASFKARFKGKYGPDAEPGNNGVNAYDAVMILTLALQKTGSDITDPTNLDLAKLRTAYRDAVFAVSRGEQLFGPDDIAGALNALSKKISIKYVGASGACRFDDTGDVQDDYEVWHVKPDGANAAYERTRLITVAELAATQ